MKPSAILEELCRENHIPAPLYPDSATVLVNGVEYRDNEKGVIDMHRKIRISFVINTKIF